jgi:UDP-glucuronate decarboxylase
MVYARACTRSYDEGKRAAETIAFDYHREHKVEIRVARIFNTYGPRMNIHDGRVVSNFITQVITSCTSHPRHSHYQLPLCSNDLLT